MREQIISVLIGLANATNNNPKTEHTDEVVLGALCAYAAAKNLPNTETVELVDETIRRIRREKNYVSPGCATCQTPCGNTSDYDLRGITEAEPAVKELKLAVLERAAGKALTVRDRLDDELGSERAGLEEERNAWYMAHEEDPEIAYCYKCLSYVGWNLAEESYRSLLSE